MTVTTLMPHSHLRFIRRELLRELFNPRYHEKWYTTYYIELFSPRKSWPNGNVNAPTLYSTSHYWAISSRNSSCLINHNCEWTLTLQINLDCNPFWSDSLGVLRNLSAINRSDITRDICHWRSVWNGPYKVLKVWTVDGIPFLRGLNFLLPLTSL